jgi:hypothetical protein
VKVKADVRLATDVAEFVHMLLATASIIAAASAQVHVPSVAFALSVFIFS